VSTRAVRNLKVSGDEISLDLELGYPGKSQHDPIRRQVTQALKQAGARTVTVKVSSKVVPHAVQRGVKLVPGIKNIIAIASGKGGVGKSTTAVNLALALAAEGASVGILDADIYGPSQPMMLGIAGRPESKDGKSLEPMEGHGLQAISIGFLIDVDTPMVWRGPMVTQALEQLLKDTRWRDLDYLVVDLPPGTGDIQLTLAQKVPVTGAVIVTTPQDIALIDAKKGLKMFEKVGIPILGIVENMSFHVCPKCGHESHIFGAGGAERMAKEYGTELLGQLPLDEGIRSQADSGKPTVVSDPDGPVAEIYRRIARRCAVKIAESQRDMTAKFPSIVVQNT
jgi:ATP-binding protein involved in chromosome partitioning